MNSWKCMTNNLYFLTGRFMLVEVSCAFLVICRSWLLTPCRNNKSTLNCYTRASPPLRPTYPSPPPHVFTWLSPHRKSGPGARKRMSKVALITSNPEKSKHLETATLRIDNFWVDFVNLRTESYVQDSRIPSINIGTPMEDSFRRCVF